MLDNWINFIELDVKSIIVIHKLNFQ
jgi:hypothetical protein